MKFAIVKDLQEIKQTLAEKTAEKMEAAKRAIEEDRKKLEETGLEDTRRAMADRAQNFERYERNYKNAPPFIKNSLRKPAIVKNEMPNFYREAIESLQKKNNRKFEELITKIYKERLEEETVEIETGKAQEIALENEKKQIEFAEKIAGKKLKVLRIEEDGDGNKRIDMQYTEDNTFTVTAEMIKEIVEG